MGVKIDKYDKRFSELVRESNDWVCETCGIQSRPESMVGVQMQCCHDKGRKFAITRLDPRNVICACASCHRKETDDEDLHVEVFTEIKGGENRRIMRERAHSGDRLKKFEKEEIHAHYKKELERIKALRMDGRQGKIEIEIPEILL